MLIGIYFFKFDHVNKIQEININIPQTFFKELGLNFIDFKKKYKVFLEIHKYHSK
jgi:hypothetical protein